MSGKPKLDITIYVAHARPWKGIVWHHSATPDGPARDWDGIVQFHTSHRIDYRIVSPEEFERRLKLRQGKVFQRPWVSIGYHFGSELVAGQVELQQGRPLDAPGAHAGVPGVSNLFNQDHIGLCAVGDFDKAPPGLEHWGFNLRLTRALLEAFAIPADRVIGHREVFDRLGVPRQKSCPGEMWDMNLFRSQL